jgi:DNA-binding CsgD family transcriptional regulator
VDASFILILQTSLLLAGASVVTPAIDARGDRSTHLLGNGLSNNEIAGVLNFTDFTAKAHV